MPVKKISDVLSPQDMKEFAAKHLGSAKKSHRNFFASCLIFLILFVYMCLISYKVYSGMEEQFTVSDE